jgi:polar amino acid transport system substrate-binding protein
VAQASSADRGPVYCDAVRLTITSLSSDDAGPHRVRTRLTPRLAAVAAALAVLALGACAPQDSDDAAAPSASGSAACDAASLKTLKPGTLTVATGKPAYEPWFSDDDPSNGKGFESAVAYAVAGKLGYPKDKVTWTAADFNAAIAPGPKQYDVNLQQVSITDERKGAVDFSSGYYDVAQAFVTLKSSKGAAARSIADLKKLQLGAATGSTSYEAILGQVKPDKTPRPYDDNDKAKLALVSGQIDALAVDLPTALYQAAAELDGGLVIGQLPNPGDAPEQFGFVLEKGSSLTSCVTQAVDALRSDGTLTKLQQQWLTDAAGAPVLS